MNDIFIFPNEAKDGVAPKAPYRVVVKDGNDFITIGRGYKNVSEKTGKAYIKAQLNSANTQYDGFTIIKVPKTEVRQQVAQVAHEAKVSAQTAQINVPKEAVFPSYPTAESEGIDIDKIDF